MAYRQRNRLDLFQSVQTQFGIEIEHRLLTELHQRLVRATGSLTGQVIDGNFDGAEELLKQALAENLFDDYITDLPYKPRWNRIVGNGPTPAMRGGHQMCIDPDDGIIYLFGTRRPLTVGGWDGTKDLADFWAFHEKEREWKCISMDTRKQGGPDPRSCHKICLDPHHKVIYTLGKYVDPDSRPNIQLDSDFWKYDIASNRWTKISANTSLEGGPDLIYDHQMLVDPEQSILYVFGGRAISPDPTQITYSGLYSWNTLENTWRLIRSDNPAQDASIQMKSRIGHSMLFNHDTREIYIFAGQRHKDFLADFYVYNLDTDSITELSRDYSKSGGPDAGFTQRATIDVGLGEFYVLSGLMREKNSLSETKNAFWVYSIKKNKWLKVYENENVGADYWSQMGHQEPRPRFAHQLVYDPIRKCQYLFGGNPGETNHPNLRLDDFWELFLTRPLPTDILRKALFQIRKQRFIELCAKGIKSDALTYLQTKVSESVCHDIPEESKVFRELVLFLFSWNPKKPENKGDISTPDSVFSARINLYESLLAYFPEAMREPKANLIDLIPMV
ncbi:Muskelin 1, intracellular mediator containing kelch motif [Kappamyces sp. JEL0680]|nr:Muskelin 1, intracellular mediator containing kelch motif [Kappamyces sp. JEL0680]